MNMVKWLTQIENMNACPEAVQWANDYDSLEEAWAACDRGDWMLWLLRKRLSDPDGPDNKKLVLTACQCARLVLPYVRAGETRPLKVIETAEAWVRGEASLADIKDAYATSAYAGIHPDNAAYAYTAVYFTVYFAADAARKSTLKQCADIVREHYPAPILEKED